MKSSISILLVTLALTFVSCAPGAQPPYVYEATPVYTTAKAVYYGNYYPGHEMNVLSLELFSEGMLDEEGGIISDAAGQRLYFQDIFIPSGENKLLPGEYIASKEGEIFSFIPGEKLKIDNISTTVGARIYYSESNPYYSTTKLIPSGSFSVEPGKITFDLKTENGLSLKGSFNGEIEYKDGILEAESDSI